MIAFSTLWNAERYEDGVSLTREIKSLGFRAVGLNYKVTEKKVAAKRRKKVRIGSPRPSGCWK
jgi:hypothetical protein